MHKQKRSELFNQLYRIEMTGLQYAELVLNEMRKGDLLDLHPAEVDKLNEFRALCEKHIHQIPTQIHQMRENHQEMNILSQIKIRTETREWRAAYIENISKICLDCYNRVLADKSTKQPFKRFLKNMKYEHSRFAVSYASLGIAA